MQSFNVLNWWIFVVITCAQEAFSLFQVLKRGLFDDAPDPSIFSDDASPQEVNPFDQTIGLGSDSFLADNVPNPISESDLNWFLAKNDYVDESDPTSLLADNIFLCDVDNFDKTQLLAKVRRDNLCRDPPVGQVENPDESSQENPFDALTRFVTDLSPLAIFPEKLEICPVEVFGIANIPVCKDELQGTTISIPLTTAVNLYFIDPGKALFCVFGNFSTQMLIGLAKFSSFPPYLHAVMEVHSFAAVGFFTTYVLLHMCLKLSATILTSQAEQT